ncbi:hypothetical protein ACFC58_02945 [Kitasatospora purpeofusca]|uniref:hypothetical protein n=1 Tax=Kitasatospora purpeofusca TaxID=67352 RepID=UPI0035E11BF9
MTRKRGVDPTPEEILATAIVNGVLGTRTVAVDDQTRPGMIDAWLAHPDEPDDVRAIGLEITSTTDGDAAAMRKAIRRQYDEAVPGLMGAWIVEFRPGARIGRAAVWLTRFLATLEQRSETKASLHPYNDKVRWNNGWPVPEYAAELEEMDRHGVIEANRISDDPQHAGLIRALTAHGYSTPPAAEHIAPYIENFLGTREGANKIQKLKAATGAAHLFIWADSSHLDIGVALRHRFHPSGDPKVPEHIDDIWLGYKVAPATVYRWTRGQGWTVHDVREKLERARGPVPPPAGSSA